MNSINPAVNGLLGVVTGDLVGSMVDRVVTLISTRAQIIEKLNLSPQIHSIVDSTVMMFLQVGLMGAGTHIMTSAFPWIVQDASAYSLYLFGLWGTSRTLKHNLNQLNNLLFNEDNTKKAMIKKGMKSEIVASEVGGNGDGETMKTDPKKDLDTE